MKEIGLWIKEILLRLLSATSRGLWWCWLRLRTAVRGLGWAGWRTILIAVPVIFFLYILFGMAYFYRIADDTGLPHTSPAGGSRTVDTVAWLIERETLEHEWTANAPVLHPAWWLDNSPSFQKGILGALSRVTLELRDQVGRMRGSSAVDEDLEKAAGNLAKEPERWVMDFSTSLLPTTPSDSYYREAARQLRRYNVRLLSGDAVFDARSDNLLNTLDRIALDLGASSAATDSYIRDHAGGMMPDTGSDDLFYQVKGQMYAYLMVLKALEVDFADVLKGRDLAPLYGELLDGMEKAAALEPFYVTNGAVDGILANHLSVQGFYLLRARTRLKELTNILLK